ncbi:hypothetical protein FSOLCH5_008012 [Fusarium solani]|nr:hypothetical protein NW759_009982 [Fusarium solani]
MCSHANTTKTTVTKTATAAALVGMANPVCSCTQCECRRIVTFPGGNLCEFCNEHHNL